MPSLAAQPLHPATRLPLTRVASREGTYDNRRSDFAKAVEQKLGRAAAVAAEAAPGMQGFNSSSQRFKPLSKRPEPGPGAYDTLENHSFVTDLQRKTHGRKRRGH